MDKRQLLKLFEAQISADIAMLKASAVAAHEAATHTESKAEDQYDTRGLEASYLAGAQAKRALELEQLELMYRHIDPLPFTAVTPIASTALIELKSSEGSAFYFLMPLGGGRQVKYEGKTIHVITPQSPLGEAILGKKVGDEIEILLQRKQRDYEIVAIW